MKSYSALVITALLAVTTSAQAEVYKWQNDLCDMQGEFDNKKYSAKQIKNSHFVLEHLTRSNLESFFPPMNIEALDKISMTDLETLTNEYNQVKRDVERLDVVPEAKNYKQQLIKTIDSEYKKDRLTILAYVDPIQAMRLSPLMCKQYLEPFFKDETAVQNKWQQFIEDKIQQQALLSDDGGKYYRNLATKRYEREKSNNPAKHAKIDLLTFGFGNCVNNQSYHADSEVVFRNQQKLNKVLFGENLTRVCEEP